MNFEKGVLCNLTGDLANFNEDGCSYYKQDLLETKKLVKKANESLTDTYSEKNLLNDLLSRKSFKSSKKIKIKKVKVDNENIIIENDNSFFIIAFVVVFVTLSYNFFYILTKPKGLVILFLSIGVLILSITGYFSFFKKFKNNEILISDMKIMFTKFNFLNEKSNITIYWNEIAEFGILTTPHQDGNKEEVLVKSHSGREILIYAGTYNTSTQKILEIIQNRKV